MVPAGEWPPLRFLHLSGPGDEVALAVTLGVGLGAIPVFTDLRLPLALGQHGKRPEWQIHTLQLVGDGHIRQIARAEPTVSPQRFAERFLRLLGRDGKADA